MIPLFITAAVRGRVAPGTPEEAGDAVLQDLADGWTLSAREARHRWSRSGGEAFVELAGRRFSYVACLPAYALPEGWCICPPRREPCHCRAVPTGAMSGPRPAQIRLTGCVALRDVDPGRLLRGDRYDDPFALSGSTQAARAAERSAHLRAELEARWTRVQERIRRWESPDPTSDLWDAVVQLRKQVAESLAAPLRFDAVEVDDDGMLLFELSDPGATVAQAAMYQLPGNEDLELTVVELEDGVLRCDPSRHPDGVREYADELRGQRRVLVLDQAATSSVLRREQHAMQDFRSDRARNPLLGRLIAAPALAREDPTLAVDEPPIQPELDAAQEAAVRQALRARDVLVVQGPPGTGKTTFISELVLRHLRRYPADTVLVASQTHQATDNLLRRVHRLDPDLPLVRVVSPRLLERKVADDIRRFWLDAPRPWVPGVRARAEHYRRYAQAQVATGAWDTQATTSLLEIQREYLGTDGAHKRRGQRLDEARVVAGTCFGVSQSSEVRERTYGLAIVEEAGKASPAEALMAMLPGEKVVLVGDSRQLPPTPDRALDQTLRLAHAHPEQIEKAALRRKAVRLAAELEAARRLIEPRAEQPEPYTAETLFAYLGRRMRTERPDLEVTLTRQYRMASGIGELISTCFYDGELENGRDDARRDPRAAALTSAHVLLVDVPGVEREDGRAQHEREAATSSRSKQNKKEADRAVRYLRRLEAAAAALPDADAREPLSVAVITGYMAQMRLLRHEVRKLDLRHLNVRVGIIDSFQGDEAEVVIVSVVRTERPGFLRTPNRINVALSRARSLVIVLCALPEARSRRLGAPLHDVVAFVDNRCEEGDPRYEIDTFRREGRR